MDSRRLTRTIRGLAFAAAALASAGLHAEEFTCRGPFARDTDHSRLVAAFGQGNVVREIVHGPEGVEFKASVVFPKDPMRRVEVIWWDEKARRRPSNMRLAGTGWSGPKALRVGTSLNEVEAANGKPFTLYGFDWDYGGTVSDWKGGALAALPGGCNLIVVFEPDESAGEAALMKAAGDDQFGSQASVMKAVRPTVARISFGYPR